jgi:transposase
LWLERLYTDAGGFRHRRPSISSGSYPLAAARRSSATGAGGTGSTDKETRRSGFYSGSKIDIPKRRNGGYSGAGEYLRDKTLMARAFSDDLRCRILQAYEPGKVSLRELAERFGVSWEYVRKIRKQHLRYGQMERVRQRRHGPVSQVTPEVQQMVRNQVRAHPDLTLWELQRQLQKQKQIWLSKSLLGLWLQRLGLRRKKNRSTPKNKTVNKGATGGKRGGSR